MENKLIQNCKRQIATNDKEAKRGKDKGCIFQFDDENFFYTNCKIILKGKGVIESEKAYKVPFFTKERLNMFFTAKMKKSFSISSKIFDCDYIKINGYVVNVNLFKKFLTKAKPIKISYGNKIRYCSPFIIVEQASTAIVVACMGVNQNANKINIDEQAIVPVENLTIREAEHGIRTKTY